MFTREEILGGLWARRARTLLFLIESRTAHLVARSRAAMDPFLSEKAEREGDLAFVEAFSAGREPPLRPTIQDLEHHSSRWAHLVPENPALRAAVIHFVGEKYRFTKGAVPGIRAALGLDSAEVQDAFRRLYGEPLESIYQPELSVLDRIRWAQTAISSWVESLPPFWAVFSLTLTETVGAGVMALPIAMAMIGPIPGAILLAVIGSINVLTIAAIAETVARTGNVRYGNSFFGRIVEQYLGSIGSSIVTIALAAICLVALLAYYLGFASTLSDATGLPAEVWAALLCLAGLYFLSRGSLSSTILSALAIGAINIALIVALSLLAFAHLDPENLAYVNVPFIGGRPFEPGVLELIFGVVLTGYFGHTSVGNCGRLVLRRDPSSRSLVLGVAAAQVAAIVIFSMWVLAVNGAVSPSELANEKGTSLAPLAAVVGPVVHPLGSLFVVLAMGMASVHFSFALFNLVRERLPLGAAPVLLLWRGGRLTLAPHGRSGEALRLSLTFLGGDKAEARFRVDALRGDATVGGDVALPASWEESDLFDRFPELRGSRLKLAVDVLEASDAWARIRLSSPMAVRCEETLETVGLGLLDSLADQGSDGQLDCRGSGNDGSGGGSASAEQGKRLLTCVLSRLAGGARGRFLLSISPILAVLLVAEAMIATGTGSFAAVLSFLGVVAVTVFAGVFPVLMLVSSRRKGDIAPPVVYRPIGHPFLMGAIYLFFLLSVFVHGIVIWQGITERAAALLSGSVVLAATAGIVKRGAFEPRVVVELRQNPQEESASFSVVAAGEAAPTGVSLELTGGEQRLHTASGIVSSLRELHRASFEIPSGFASEFKVWAHRATPDGQSESLPATLELKCGGEQREFDLKLTGGQVVHPLPKGRCSLELRLDVS